MSCYVVDREHIDTLLLAAQQLGRGSGITWEGDEENDADMRDLTFAGIGCNFRTSRGDLSPVGRMLWRENVRSVQYRYPDTVESGEMPGPVSFDELEALTYTFPVRFGPILHPAKVLVALQAYEYQSCEHPGWRDSEAHAFCEALKGAAVDAIVAQVPGARDCWNATPEKCRDMAHAPIEERRRMAGGAR